MNPVEFLVHKKQIGEYTCLFVPKEVEAARGAGLVVSHRDPETARRYFGMAMDTAKRFGVVHPDSTWRLSTGS